MATTTVILPWRGGCEHRERARSFVVARYAAERPDWAVIEAECPPGAWSKSRAVAPALRTAENGAVIVADADCWSDGIDSAVRAVTVGAANWAMPHGIIYRLTEEGTDQFIRSGSTWTGEVERRPYEGVWGGGIVVAHRDTLLDIPLDPRFEGWGGEDESWAVALECLAGPGYRIGADLIHLYHPREVPDTKWGTKANWQLRRRYGRAGRDPEAMRSLIKEAHATLNDDDQYAVHDRPASRS